MVPATPRDVQRYLWTPIPGAFEAFHQGSPEGGVHKQPFPPTARNTWCVLQSTLCARLRSASSSHDTGQVYASLHTLCSRSPPSHILHHGQNSFHCNVTYHLRRHRQAYRVLVRVGAPAVPWSVLVCVLDPSPFLEPLERGQALMFGMRMMSCGLCVVYTRIQRSISWPRGDATGAVLPLGAHLVA